MMSSGLSVPMPAIPIPALLVPYAAPIAACTPSAPTPPSVPARTHSRRSSAAEGGRISQGRDRREGSWDERLLLRLRSRRRERKVGRALLTSRLLLSERVVGRRESAGGTTPGLNYSLGQPQVSTATTTTRRRRRARTSGSYVKLTEQTVRKNRIHNESKKPSVRDVDARPQLYNGMLDSTRSLYPSGPK